MPMTFEQVIIMGLVLILTFMFSFGFENAFFIFVLVLVLIVLVLVLIGIYEGYLIDGSFIIFDLFITVILVGFPGILWSLIVLIIIKKYYPEMIFKRLRKKNKLSEIVMLQLEGNNLVRNVDKQSIKNHISFWPPLLYLSVSGAILLFFYNYFVNLSISTFFEVGYLTHRFDLGLGHRYLRGYYMENVALSLIPLMDNWRNSSDFIISLTFSSISSVLVFLKFHPIKKMYISLEAKVDKFSSDLEDTSLILIDKIKKFEEDIDKIANYFGCSIEHLYIENIEQFIEDNRKKIVNDKTCLEQKLKEEKDKAEDDYKKLGRCYSHYQVTIKLAKETARIVNRIGEKSYIEEMNEISRSLDNLKILIENKKWSRFEYFLSKIRKSLGQFKDGAERYMRTFAGQKSYSKKQKKSRSNQGNDNDTSGQKNNSAENMERDKALDILGIKEKKISAEILKACSERVKFWHPDKYKEASGISKEEWTERYLLVKTAYDFLEKSFKKGID